VAISRTAVGVALIVILLISFFDIRADITNASGIGNVQTYMKAYFWL
jgi:hypothetical protein